MTLSLRKNRYNAIFHNQT